MKSDLKKRVERHDSIGDVRRRGLFVGIEMIKDSVSRKPDPDCAVATANRLKDKGILISTDGKFNNILKIRPPLIFSHEHAAEFLKAFDETMEEIDER